MAVRAAAAAETAGFMRTVAKKLTDRSVDDIEVAYVVLITEATAHYRHVPTDHRAPIHREASMEIAGFVDQLTGRLYRDSHPPTPRAVSLPASPGEGIDWKPGEVVFVSWKERDHEATRAAGDHRRRFKDVFREATISKAGRRWVEIDGIRGRFDRNTGLEDSGIEQKRVWVDQAAFERSSERERMTTEVREVFRDYRDPFKDNTLVEVGELHGLLTRLGLIVPPDTDTEETN